MKLFVADAKYRANLKYDAVERPHGNPQLFVATKYFNGVADDNTAPLTYTKSDAWIQSTYATLRNDGTARSNTDFLMKYGTTSAAHHCRKQDIPGVGQLDLPNLYELIILYLESDNIDALDPTVESNRGKALGMMNVSGRFDFYVGAFWSSTERDDYAWTVHSTGCVWSYSQRNTHGVAPVKELDS